MCDCDKRERFVTLQSVIKTWPEGTGNDTRPPSSSILSSPEPLTRLSVRFSCHGRGCRQVEQRPHLRPER